MVWFEMSSLILGSSSLARRGKAFKYVVSVLLRLPPFLGRISCVNLVMI